MGCGYWRRLLSFFSCEKQTKTRIWNRRQKDDSHARLVLEGGKREPGVGQSWSHTGHSAARGRIPFPPPSSTGTSTRVALEALLPLRNGARLPCARPEWQRDTSSMPVRG